VVVVVPVVSPKRRAAVGDIETELGAPIPYAVQKTVDVARGFLPNTIVSAVLMLAVVLDHVQDCPGPVPGILQPLTLVSVQGGTAGAPVLIVWLAPASGECWTSGLQRNYLDGSSVTFPAGLERKHPAVAAALGVVKLNGRRTPTAPEAALLDRVPETVALAAGQVIATAFVCVGEDEHKLQPLEFEGRPTSGVSAPAKPGVRNQLSLASLFEKTAAPWQEAGVASSGNSWRRCLSVADDAVLVGCLY